MTCGHCGGGMHGGATSCPSCGFGVCGGCGSMMAPGVMTCGGCGWHGGRESLNQEIGDYEATRSRVQQLEAEGKADPAVLQQAEANESTARRRLVMGSAGAVVGVVVLIYLLASH